jgi:hypothetical protein
MKRIVMLVTVMSLSILMNVTNAQSEVKKYVDKNGKEKIVKKIKKNIGKPYTREDGMGVYAHLTSLNQIKSIGMVAFNVNSPGYVHKRKYGYVTVTKKQNITQSGGNMISNALHYGSDETKTTGAYRLFNEQLTKKGINLFIPAQYCEAASTKNDPNEYEIDDAKLKYYTNFEPERMKVIGKMLGKGEADAPAAGYAPFVFADGAGGDWKVTNSFGHDFTTNFGLDAVMFVEINLIVEKNYVGVKDIKVSVIGKNPTPYVEGKNYIKQLGGYPKAQLYFNSSIDFGEKGLSFIKLKKGEVVEESFEGFDDLLECFAIAMVETWEEMIKKNTK